MNVFKAYKLKDYVTLIGTFCGLAAIFIPIYFRKDDVWYVVANVFIFWGIFFDLLDGFIARKFDQINDLGKQLDSLSDGIVLVVAPAIITFIMYCDSPLTVVEIPGLPWWFMFITMFIFIVTGISRLAWFNVQKDVCYTGLPTPISAGFVCLLNCVNIALWKINENPIQFNFVIQYAVPIVLIFLGWCNITDHIYYGQNVRKKIGSTKIIIKVGVFIGFILFFFAIFQKSSFLIFLLIGLFGFLIFAFIFISIGFVNAYNLKKTYSGTNKQG